MNGTIEIIWNPATFLMLSRNPENISYEVKVNDLQERIVDTTTSSNFLTADLPNYTPFNASCISFNITVVASNSAGRGNSSSIMKSVLQTGY